MVSWIPDWPSAQYIGEDDRELLVLPLPQDAGITGRAPTTPDDGVLAGHLCGSSPALYQPDHIPPPQRAFVNLSPHRRVNNSCADVHNRILKYLHSG